MGAVSGAKARRRSITTGEGDRGTTRLFSGERVSKDSPRLDVCGDLDEFNAVLGVARASASLPETREAVLRLQKDSMMAAAEVATTSENLGLLKERIDAARIRSFERARAALESRLRLPRGFVVPGAKRSAALLDHARAVARRCERKMVRLSRAGDLWNEHLLVWINRASDYLWLLARLEETGPESVSRGSRARPVVRMTGGDRWTWD